MAQEDQIQRGSNSSGSSFLVGSSNSEFSSKNPRPKKVPQRGLGVAQLEKIIEEQQNKGVAAMASPSILSPPSLPVQNHPHSNQSSSSISFPSASQANLSSSSNLRTRLPFPAQSVDSGNSVNPPLINQTSYTGFEHLWPGSTVLGQADGASIWNFSEYLKGRNDGADPGLPFQWNAFLPYQTNFSRPPIPFTQESSSISVNSASATSPSSMVNFPMEPPSNQNYHYKNLTTQCPEQEQLRGMKRPYPFSPDDPSGFSSMPVRSDTSALHEKRGSFRKRKFRDSSSYSTSTFAQNTKKSYPENRVSKDYLSLATPYPAFHHCEPPDFESLPFQKNEEVPTATSEESSVPLYTFIPPADVRTGNGGDDARKNGGETEESVDLDLKL